MSLYLDPDTDNACKGPLFDLPEGLYAGSESMHASAVVIDRVGILLRGPSGSGKSVLQRQLRDLAEARGVHALLVSDDYVRLVRPELRAPYRNGNAPIPPLVAFAPLATQKMQEVRGFGVVSLEDERLMSPAVMHLLVDLVPPERILRMPQKEESRISCLGHSIDHLSVPSCSALVACDLVFARLSTWKHSS